MTIIGLVAVVLLTLGLFLFQYIETSFPKSQDQTENMRKLAAKVAIDYSLHRDIPSYIQLVNELLSAQEASVIAISTDFKPLDALDVPLPALEGVSPETGAAFRYNDFFTEQELGAVFAGASIDNQTGTAGRPRYGVNGQYTAVAVPIANESQTNIIGALVLYQVTQSFAEMQNYVKNLFVVVGIIGFSMTTFFAFFLSTKITQPIRQLNKAADLMSKGQFGTRVPTNFPDEIGELGKTFNHMGAELAETIKALNHEKEHLASVLRSMADAVMTIDADGVVILTNPEGEKVIREWNHLGWEHDWPDAVDGSLPEAGEQEQEPPLPKVPGPMRPLFETVMADPRELTSKLNVKSEVWSIVMAPLYSRDGVRGVVAVLRNVTEEHRLDKLRKDFLANVSHELRTPLSMLQGYSEALIDDIAASPEERKELAQVIHDESLRMGRLVRDLLDLAKMESGTMELHLRPMDVGVLIRRVHRKFAALAKEHSLTLVCDLLGSEHYMCNADEDRMEQVLTNLLDNAIRHTPPGKSITMRAESELRSGRRMVRIDVSDQGQGIPAEDVPYIFERFYKADKARTRGVSGGTGLGLSIAKNIIEAHQGDAQVKSQVGQGTTFSIFLPQLDENG